MKTQMPADSHTLPAVQPQEVKIDALENIKSADNVYNFSIVKNGIDEDIEKEPVIQILLDKFNGELLK